MSKNKFLSDKPEGIDSFQSQAHTKIANVIADIIKKDEIKLIGLEGEWGSGKSNIVKLLENKLSEEKYIFYTYDAWGHQEDLQRRSFLENLTELMKNKFSEEDWENKLKNLLSKKTEVEEKEVPRLNKELILAIFILYFNNKITNQDFFELGSLIPIQYPNLKKIAELILSNSIFILGFLSLYIFLKYLKKEKDGENKENNLSTILYLYKGKVLNKKLETIVSTKEPSVREFKNWMKEVSKTLRNKNKRLIVIYDNIDRLQENKVKEVWSSIHTFFSEDDYDNIFVIIPFSKKHILTAFKGKYNEVNEGIIEKTFPVVYNVTPPVLVDWKNYFNENLELIFLNINEEDKNIIRTLYNKNVEKITPRGIKSFINELKVLNSIHTNIELKYISLFVLIKEKIQADFPNYFYGEEFPKYRRILGNNTDKKIIALYFGIDEKDAIQVLLEREMIKNLENGDFSKIDEQSQINGFNEVLQKVITDLYGDGELQGIYRKALVAIKNQKVNSFISDSFLNSFKNEEKTFSFQEYHKILLEKCSQNEEEIFKKLFFIDFYSGDETQNIKSLCDELKELENYMKEKNYIFSKYIKVREYEPVIFFQMLEEFKNSYLYYGVSFIEKDMEDYLIYNLKSFNENYMKNLDILIPKYDFSNLKNSLFSRIKIDRENMITSNEYTTFMKLLNKNNENLVDLGLDFNYEVLNLQLSKLITKYNTMNIEKYHIISLILTYVSHYPHIVNSISNFNYILNSIPDNDIIEIEKIIINYVEIDKILLLLKNYPNEKFTKIFVKKLIEEKNIKYFNLKNIINEYHQIKSIIPKELNNEFFILSNKFYKNNLNFDYQKFFSDSRDYSIIIDSKDLDLDLVIYLQELCIEYFNQENIGEFLYQECKNQNYNFLNIYEVIINNPNLNITSSILNSFEKLLSEIIDNSTILNDKNKNILNKIKSKIQKEDIQNIINVIIKEKIISKSSLSYNVCLFFYDLFKRTKFFYFDKNDLSNQSKVDNYNKLILVLLDPYISHKETKDFILGCPEFKNGITLLKKSNQSFLNKLKSIYKQDIEVQNFIIELEKEGENK